MLIYRSAGSEAHKYKLLNTLNSNSQFMSVLSREKKKSKHLKAVKAGKQ